MGKQAQRDFVLVFLPFYIEELEKADTTPCTEISKQVLAHLKKYLIIFYFEQRQNKM